VKPVLEYAGRRPKAARATTSGGVHPGGGAIPVVAWGGRIRAV